MRLKGVWKIIRYCERSEPMSLTQQFANTALMKISAEGFDYDKKWDIDGSRYNVLLKFRYNKKTKSIFNIEICLKMKYSNIWVNANVYNKNSSEV